MWRSLVARSVRVGEVPSSNLGTPISSLALAGRGRYLPSAVDVSRKTSVWSYYLGVVALIVVGANLWATGHGTR